MKRFLVYTLIAIVLLIIVISLCNYKINKQSRPFIYSQIDQIPSINVGLLLGTSKNLKGGGINPYFLYRILATVDLYKQHKIKYIIVSGDNHHMSYNEPMMMKKELIKYSIPDSVIYLDYAGFRTFDSVIRCREIFGQNNYILISQNFHLERAVYIAHRFGIGAIGYVAKDVGFSEGLKTRFREYFARLKVFIDIYSGNKPKFLGEKVNIE